MHAFLLINDNPEEFAKKEGARIWPFSLQKIDDVRELKKIIKFTFSTKTAIVISDIDLATDEALNSFLKNLEEPCNNLIYVLTAKNIKNVLPTIVSRCEVVVLNKQKKILDEKDNKIIGQFIEGNINKKFETIEKIKDRIEAIDFIEKLIYKELEDRRFKNMESYLKTISNLKANGNVSLQMANLLVTMNSQS